LDSYDDAEEWLYLAVWLPFFFFFLIKMDVRVSLCASTNPMGSEVNNHVSF
jgi:hypothetical protein